MANDFRSRDSLGELRLERATQIVVECKRQEESCLYTSTALYEWHKCLRCWRVVFVVLPIVLGALATWSWLAKQQGMEWVTAACAMLSGLVPAVYKALDFDISLVTVVKQANEFKTLQDRFRQAATITTQRDVTTLEEEFRGLMERMDKARASSFTPPERFFNRAQKKIARGDYNFSIDHSTP